VGLAGQLRIGRRELSQKSYWIVTFGCQMNKLDSQIAAGQLEAMGLVEADSPSSADIVIVNSCSVRSRAQSRALAVLSNFSGRRRSSARPAVVGIMGCVAQQMGQRLVEPPYGADFVLGPGALCRLAETVEKVLAQEGPVVSTEPGCLDRDLTSAAAKRKEARSAFVAITRGCSNFCSFCIVPYVRGGLVSRPFDSILEEVKALVDSGYIDICLLGQSVNSYSYQGVGFEDLLGRLLGIDGIKRLWFVTTHPKDLTFETVEMMSQPPMMPYISLPLQSGSDRILALMNRGYTREEYLEKVGWIRSTVKDSAISTDVVVGFPGETEDDFEQTLDVIRRVKFENVYSFLYSPRPFTEAAKLGDQVPAEVARARFERLLSLQRRIRLQRMRSFEGRTVEVLVQGPSRKNASVLSGRSRQNLVVNLPYDECQPGETVLAKVVKSGPNSLIGRVVRRLP